jgi:putative endonuclease
MVPGVVRMPARTRRRRSGDRAEDIARRHLEGSGWVVLAANVAVGRDEIDIVAVDPGPPRCLVVVEVRGNSGGRFGTPEESAVGAKLQRTYRAALALMHLGRLPAGGRLPRGPWRVDLIAVELAPRLGPSAGGPVVRHVRGVRPD